MKKTIRALYRTAAVLGALFAWTIAAEMNMLPRLADSEWLRWQVLVVLGLLVVVTADRIADLRCRCCGSEHVLLRGLFSRSRELLCHGCLRWEAELKPAEQTSNTGALPQ